MVGSGHGSGVHIGGGYVLTAAHVVAGSLNAPKDKPLPVKIRDDKGGETDVEVLWSSERYDVALVRIEHPVMAAAPIECRAPSIGEAIVVQGNPGSMTWVSTWGRVGSAEQELGRWARAVVIDAAVLPGNSGGPAFTEDGNVIGIITGASTAGSFPVLTAVGINIMVPAPVICELLAR
jgi:S1-C subfamily serine protease